MNQAIKFIRSNLVDDLRIIAYHRICDVDNVNDPELVSATVDDFDWQISYIKKYYNPLTFAQVIERLNNNQKLPANSIIVTFDDGFTDNYRNAYPILKKYLVPATFFISTGYIGSDETFWFNFISRTIMRNPGKSIEVLSREYNISESLVDRRTLVPIILEICKRVANSKRLEIIENIKSQLGDFENCDVLAKPMSWENIREMSANGIEFGSHSVTHPILSQLTPEEMKIEICDSKKEIENQINREIQVIAYPVGGDFSINQAVLDEVELAGYELGATYISGNNYYPKLKDYQLKRGHIERYVGRAQFASMLSLPELFC